jgi:hypothetical protein
MRGNRCVPFLLASASLLLGLLTAAPPAGAGPVATCTARVVPSPNVGTGENILTAVSVVSASDAWAVGYEYAGDPFPIDTLILHWNGATWAVVESPNPGASSNVLSGVSALSANDAWAVGHTSDKEFGHVRSLILHWDGSSWSEAHVRLPKDAGNNGLNAVHALTADDVWAVGSVVKPRPPVSTLTLHWDGSGWRTVPSPNSRDPLNGANANALWSVDAAASTDVWSVGNFGDDDNANGDNSTLSIQWDGSRWSTVKSPNPKPIDYFRGVSVVSSNEIWAAGFELLDRYASPRALVATNDGDRWTIVPTETLPSMHVVALDAVSATEVWIGGNQEISDVGYPIVARWDGGAWTVATQPGPAGNVNGVANATGGELWAVGFRIAPDQFLRTLIERVAC